MVGEQTDWMGGRGGSYPTVGGALAVGGIPPRNPISGDGCRREVEAPRLRAAPPGAITTRCSRSPLPPWSKVATCRPSTPRKAGYHAFTRNRNKIDFQGLDRSNRRRRYPVCTRIDEHEGEYQSGMVTNSRASWAVP